jgi:hypothetical protein
MANALNIPALLAALRHTGDLFLPNFRRTAIPQEMATFSQQLADIEARCLADLQGQLASNFPTTPWLSADFSNLAPGQQPAALEYWLCDAMDGAHQHEVNRPAG